MKKKNFLFRLKTIINLMSFLFLLSNCNNSDSRVQSPPTDGENVWLVKETSLNDIPLVNPDTTFPVMTASQAEPANERTTATPESTDVIPGLQDDIATIGEIADDLEALDYIAQNTVEVSQAIVPLDEDQTLVAYNKKGKEKAGIQVVSNAATGEIEQVAFADKNHKDEYNVEAGMSGKEVKRLRKDLKHTIHKGKVFLYNDESNVMYLMDAQNLAGDEVTDADIETMNVQSIIWKPKKHHSMKH